METPKNKVILPIELLLRNDIISDENGLVATVTEKTDRYIRIYLPTFQFSRKFFFHQCAGLTFTLVKRVSNVPVNNVLKEPINIMGKTCIKRSLDKWEKRFMKLAAEVSTWSKDPSTQCGAVIADGNLIKALGYNGFPRNVKDDQEILIDRDRKYPRTIHAELNAILNASGQNLLGCTIYVHPMPPCAPCMACIIQSGISSVITYAPTDEQVSRWGSSFKEALLMAEEAGVYIIYATV